MLAVVLIVLLVLALLGVWKVSLWGLVLVFALICLIAWAFGRS